MCFISAAPETSTESVVYIADTLMQVCQVDTIGRILESSGSTCETIQVDDKTYIPVYPDSLRFVDEPVPQHEGVLFSKQPSIRGYDSAVSEIFILSNQTESQGYGVDLDQIL